ncbi:MAG: carboxylating nicotinate-nucleotide diphosphorylase [Chthoniobacterales bacterium]
MKPQPAPHDPIGIALAEDLGSGDVTTDSFVARAARAHARIVAREAAIIAGTMTAAEVFRRVDSELAIEIQKTDGSQVDAGDSVLEIHGRAASILTGERVALNFLQRLSGIATLTRNFVDAAKNPAVKILDTRKTTPGLRALEKAAVLAGGGANHRFGLFDMVLVKDNHLAAGANLRAAIGDLRRQHPEVKIEVEADTLEQVRGFLTLPEVDIILLDNMSPPMLREAVALRQNSRVKFEASGGVTLETIGEIAATGVDLISIGAVTHSARAIDLSLELTHVAD